MFITEKLSHAGIELKKNSFAPIPDNEWYPHVGEPLSLRERGLIRFRVAFPCLLP